MEVFADHAFSRRNGVPQGSELRHDAGAALQTATSTAAREPEFELGEQVGSVGDIGRYLPDIVARYSGDAAGGANHGDGYNG